MLSTTARKPAGTATTTRKSASATARKVAAASRTARPRRVTAAGRVTAAALRKRDARSNQHQGTRHQSGKREFERTQFVDHKNLIPGGDAAFELP